MSVGVVVRGPGGVAGFDVAGVQFQDLSGVFHTVVAGDPRGRAQKLLSGLMLIDNDVTRRVATPTSHVTLCSDDPRGLSRVDGADSLSVQGVGVDAVGAASRRVVCHVVVGFGPAGTTRATEKWWVPVMKGEVTQ